MDAKDFLERLVGHSLSDIQSAIERIQERTKDIRSADDFLSSPEGRPKALYVSLIAICFNSRPHVGGDLAPGVFIMNSNCFFCPSSFNGGLFDIARSVTIGLQAVDGPNISEKTGGKTLLSSYLIEYFPNLQKKSYLCLERMADFWLVIWNFHLFCLTLPTERKGSVRQKHYGL